ncbi:hypothetical protein [uncultured Ramlibacter sp.]|uniref:hypothetical protein n=1 Tax=uncultured Ramlibacter sp. TaxID=260755 RepID=UPI00262228F3|nr:hypothetical protein [uncultured Ramlibacter sp.]
MRKLKVTDVELALPYFQVRQFYEIQNADGRLLATLVVKGRGQNEFEARADVDPLSSQLRALGIGSDGLYYGTGWDEWYLIDRELGLVDAIRLWDKCDPDYAVRLAARTLVPETQKQALDMYGIDRHG